MSPEIMADMKTLQEFMASQQKSAGPLPQGLPAPSPGGAVVPAPSPGGNVVPSPRALPAPAGGGAVTKAPLSLEGLPRPQQAVVMGALGRLLTAASARIGGGVAGAAVPKPANAKEPADLKASGLGTGASAVKMQDWDKTAKPFKAPDAKPAAKAADPVVAPVAKKPDSKLEPTPVAKPAAKPLSKFERAFAAAVKDPSKPNVFEWNGKKYKVALADGGKRGARKSSSSSSSSGDDKVSDALNTAELGRVQGKIS
jgi:hypothetical protein